MPVPSVAGLGLRLRPGGDRSYRLARLDLADALDDEPVAGTEALRHQPLVADHAVDDHVAAGDRKAGGLRWLAAALAAAAAGAAAAARAAAAGTAAALILAARLFLLVRIVANDDHRRRIAARIPRDAGDRRKDRIDGGLLAQPRAGEHPRQQDPIRIWKARAERHRAGRRIDHRLGEFDVALGVVFLPVAEFERDRRRRRDAPAAAQLAAQVEQVGARLLDVDEDRIEPLDRRQRRRLSDRDEPARGHQRTADAAGDRRGNVGETQIDLGGAHRGAVLRDGGGGLVGGRFRVGVILFRDRLQIGERLVAIGLASGGDGIGLGAREIGLRLRECRAILGRVDPVQYLSLMDDAALGEGPREDQPRDLRPDIGRLEGAGPPGQLDEQRHRLRLEDHIARFGGGGGPLSSLGVHATAARNTTLTSAPRRGIGAGIM